MCLRKLKKMKVTFKFDNYPIIIKKSSAFESNFGSIHGWFHKGVNILKLKLKYFNGSKVLTWVRHIDKYF